MLSAGQTAAMGWLWALLITGVLVGAGYATLVLLARRLLPGSARDLAAFIPDCLTTVRRLRRDHRVPRRARVALLIAMAWVLSPVDLIPEFVPVIGPLDDVVVVAICVRYAGRQVPRPVLLEAWPGDAKMMERLLGTKAGGTSFRTRSS